jgi:hypothetical protein
MISIIQQMTIKISKLLASQIQWGERLIRESFLLINVVYYFSRKIVHLP